MNYTRAKKLAYARLLRRHGTPAEKIARPYLWLVGYKAQAYDPTGFLPDFYSSWWRVAIELDGSVHSRREQRKQDKYKDRARRKNKVYTLRAGNRYVIYAMPVLMIEALLTGIIYRTWRGGMDVFIKVLKGIRL